jgi:phosphatidylglycerophosphatase A
MRAVASGLGVGYALVAPGTLGSLMALPLWYWGGGWGGIHFGALGIILLLAVPAARAGIEAAGVKDPSCVVIDEVAGMLLAATGIPWEWPSVILLFFLFRAFDILKFGPAAWLNAREGPFFTVADDLMAGVYANLAYRGIMWLIGS